MGPSKTLPVVIREIVAETVTFSSANQGALLRKGTGTALAKALRGEGWWHVGRTDHGSHRGMRQRGSPPARSSYRASSQTSSPSLLCHYMRASD